MDVSEEESAEGGNVTLDEPITDGLEMEFGDEGDDGDGPDEICLDDIEDDGASDLPSLSGLPAPSSQPLFDPSDPIEDVVEENVGGGKGEKDDAHCPRPVARPLNAVNPKSLPYDPNDEVALFGSDASDEDDVQVMHESIVAVPTGSSSSSAGSGSDRAAQMKAIMDQMKALQERLDNMYLINDIKCKILGYMIYAYIFIVLV